MLFIFVLMFFLFILGTQIKHARQVEISEKFHRKTLLLMFATALLFVAWGVFIVRELAFILVTIVIASIILFRQKTTGLSQSQIIYQQNTGGIASFAPKTRPINQIINTSIQEKNQLLQVTFNIQHQTTIQMHFALEDRQKIYQYIAPYSPIEEK